MQETEEQLHRHTSRLKHLQNSQTKFTAIPDSSSDKFGDYLVLLGAIMREEMMIDWLKNVSNCSVNMLPLPSNRRSLRIDPVTPPLLFPAFLHLQAADPEP
ncbi:MAG: hypothetical protein ACLROW_10070 [Roseburia faecis]